MNFLNSIYYKTLIALYKLNTDKNGRSKSVLIDAIYEALKIGDEGLQNGKLAMALDTATGEWLDYWGYVLGVSRDFGENDDDYRIRIIEEIIAPKNTIEAIKRATARKINKDHKEEFIPESIRVFEPWTELIILDERGVLDGTSRIISYDYWIYSVIDISLPDSSYITPDLIKYLNKIKAGGVKIVFSLAPRWDIITDIDRLERNTHVWEKIHRNTYIDVKEVDNTIFHTVPIGATNEEDIQNTILDGFSLLEGKQIIYWDGVELSRSYYGTGVIRNYAGGYLSLEDLAVIMQKENPTIADALEYERQAIEGTRVKEGKFNISLKPIEIKTERI